MATTGAPWNIPYVEPTDIPRTYPEDSEDLALAIAAGLSAAGPDTIERTGTDTTRIEVGDNGQINVADATSPTPVVRALPFAIATGEVATGTIVAGGNVSGTTTFPVDRFTSAPVVMMTARNPARNFPYIYTTSISTSSFSWVVGNTSAFTDTFNFQYLALQLTF